MEIKLSIKQDDIEQAIKDYVASKGITTPVREIHFAVARKGGFSLTAEVEVSETPVEASIPSGPINRTQAETPEPPAEEPKVKAKPTVKADVTKAKEVKEEPVQEEVAEDTTPFDTDAKAENDEQPVKTERKPSNSKSLFG